jgi:hypothetical protein
VVFLVVAVLLAPLTVVGGWARAQITDTERYVRTVRPLAENPELQRYVAEEIADAIYAQLDVQGFLRGVLPEQLQPLAPTLSSAVEGFLDQAANRFTASPAFVTLWVEANRAGHRVVSGILTADLAVTDLENGQLTLDLGEVLRRFQTFLVERGFDLAGRVDLSGVERSIVIAEGPQLERIENARRLVGALNTLVWVLFVAMIACAVLSVVVAPARRRALARLGVGLALAMVLVAIGLSVARRQFLEAIAGALPSPVAAGFFDTIVSSMRAGFRAVFVAGLVIAAFVAVTGLDSYATRWARPAQVAAAVIGVIALLAPDDYATMYVVFVVAGTALAIVGLEVARQRRLQPAAIDP